MTSLGIGVGIASSEENVATRTGTLSPYDFAYWASTFVARGKPSDYSDSGEETDGLSLVVWAARKIGVTFSSTFALALASLTEIDIDQALNTRGALVVFPTSIGVTLGLGDVVRVINGRYFVYRIDYDSTLRSRIVGALLPGAKY